MKDIGNNRKWWWLRSATPWAALLGLAFAFVHSAEASDSLCATVKIEIQQELTLERQAFDAHMRINNGLANIALENVGVVVTFADTDGNTVSATSDPNNTNALFYIRIDTIDNIANVSGSGTVAASTSADIHWLIIPAVGAGGTAASGVRYLVGARLTYSIGAEAHTMDVVPDSILVKPMPMLDLDYFLPSEVYGDDPFTEAIELPVPFTLGLRIKNAGYGPANSLAIQSAQPQIVDNKLGLLVNFQITGSEVNGLPSTPSLMCNFGNLQPNASGIARWIMTCSLSGRFVSFTASYSHSDNLGGQLTSLIAGQPKTHALVHDVLVDLPGRDDIRDFLAKDADVLRVYESQNVDTTVTDQSANSAISGSSSRYTVTTAPSAGLSFIKLSDPLAGAMALRSATRADGKAINAANAWLSKTQDKNTHQWSYFVNVFDGNNTAGLSYALTFGALPGQTNRPPVLDPIPDHTVPAGQYLNFSITASDPDANALQFALGGVPPSGVTFDTHTGNFTWHPTEDQIGTNTFSVTVTDDGQPPLSTSGSFAVIVTGPGPVSMHGTVFYYPANYPPSQPSDKRVGGVAVNLDSGPNVLTSADGAYGLSDIPVGQDYRMTVSKADDDPPANGVTTLDIALIRRHILALGPLDSPYKLLAADANGSGTTSTLDIAFIRKLILGLTNSMPAGLWRFVPADFVFPDPQNPWNAPSYRSYTNLLTDITGQDFIAIKVGDVNNSWTNSLLEPRARIMAPPPQPTVGFQAGRRVVQPGERVTVGVSVTAFEKVTSAQFTLQWDSTMLRFIGVGEFGLHGLSEGNFGAALGVGGNLTFSWDDPDTTGVTLADGTTIFTMSFEVVGKAGSVSPVAFVSTPTASETTVQLALVGMITQDGQVAVIGLKPEIACARDPAPGIVLVSVPTMNGVRYVLEFNESLSGTPWHTISTVLGDGAVQTMTDSSATNHQRFYRVRIE